ncbi:MAG: hypothetical protein ACK5V3_10815, partial [Bdellovibrionales bacterium]
NGPVNALAFDSVNNLIFIAGDFTNIFQGMSANARNGRLAALNYNATTGLISLNAFASSLSLNAPVFSLLVHDSWLYVGGGFTLANVTSVNRLLRFRIVLGGNTPDTWPTSYQGPNNAVMAMDHDPNQNRIIFGGYFTSVAGSSRDLVAAINVATGNLDTFNPSPNGDNVRYVKVSGPRLYLSGNFNTIGGSARNGLARYDLTTDALDTWNPAGNHGPGSILPMLISHEAAYIAGNFTNLGGVSVSRLGRVDLISAAGMVEFSTGSPENRAALSFSPFDLIKRIYVSAESPLIGPVTIQITDGNQSVGLSFDVRSN